MQPGSIGDLGGGVMLAGAVAAALFRRERTGQGAVVDNALYLAGIYLMSQSVIAASLGLERKVVSRDEAPDALINTYRTSDDRWIALCFLNAEWWPDLAAHLDRPDLAEDARFATAQARQQNRQALKAELAGIFGARPYVFWTDRLSTLDGVWAPLQSPVEVMNDPQALANGFVVPVTTADGRSYMGGASPAQFDERPIGELRAAPGYGEHGEPVLRELGLDDRTIAALRERGVVGG